MLILTAALSDNYCIGKGGEIPWTLPGPEKRSKRRTVNSACIMGRSTWDRLPKPADDQVNIVVTHDLSWQPPELVFVKHNYDAALKLAACVAGNTFIIGGASLYSAFMRRAERMYLTRVHTHIEDGDKFFPHWSPDEWMLTDATRLEPTDLNPLARTYETWEKRN